jgi:hypothetical protein
METRQVGGMQEVFLELRWKTIRGVERAVSAVENAGGRVLHAYLPSIMVASVPSDQVGRLVGKGGIVSATTEPLPEESVRSLIARPTLRCKHGTSISIWIDACVP